MMKRIFLSVILIVPLFTTAQDTEYNFVFPVDSASGLITYTEVVIQNDSAKLLYSRGKEWISKTFVSAKAVIEMDDNLNYKVFGNAIIDMYPGIVKYSFSLYFKNGKFKYVFTNFIHDCNICNPELKVPLESGPDKGMLAPVYRNKKNWDKIKYNTNQKILSLIGSLKEFMKIETENW
jgi:hypothetical protein